ncbi:MAG TPA: ABC transporter [Cytophagales bacterium]|jgi:putative ABC transport system permease protein|nr:ABC transporter [Cytophagales bacterium]
MIVVENVREGIRSIRANMLRSVLTAIIIAFGIMALVGMLTAIDGLKASINSSFSSLGANTFDVRNKENSRDRRGGVQERLAPPLELKEVETFKEKFNVGRLTLHTRVTSIAELKRQSEKTNPNVTLRGIDEEYMLIKDYTIEEGRNFTALDIRYNSNLCIIGSEVKKALFKENESPINELISFYGTQYKVIGVLEEKGGFGGNTYADRTVFVSLDNAVRIAADRQLNYTITVAIEDPSKMQYAIGEATGLMRKVRKDPPGSDLSFEISRNKTLEEELEEIGGYMRIGGFVIGAITLLGASVALMNIMLVSVTERTREIGVRKATGATPKRIRQQFLIEAILICILGGLGGVILGLIVGNLVANLIDAGVFVTPWEWVSIGLVVCFVVGMISGYYPAYKASRLDPIESLRYE